MSARPAADSPFGTRVLVVLVVVATLSFAAALVAGGLGSTLAPRSYGADSYSRSAVGHRALLEFLTARGIGAMSRRDPGEARPRDTVPLVLLEPRAWPVELAHEAINEEAPLVLALPKRDVAPDPNHEGWIWMSAAIDSGVLAPLLQPRPLTDARLKLSYFDGDRERRCRTWLDRDVTVVLGQPAQLLVDLPESFEPVVSCDDGVLIAHAKADGNDHEFYVIADPDLFNNQGLARGDHAAIVEQLFRNDIEATGVIVDETIHGYGARFSLIAELLRFPLSLATAAALVLLTTVLWSGMRRFGRARALPPQLGPGKAVLIDNAARLMRLSPHAGPFLERFVAQAVADVAAHVAQPVTQDEGALLATLARIGAAHGITTDPAALVARIRGAAQAPTLSHEHAARLAQDVHGWRQEMIDGTRGHS